MGFHFTPPTVEVNYPEVEVHADLPAAADNDGEIYLVKTGTGIFGVNKKRAGMWLSDGVEWKRLGLLTGSGGVVYGTAPDGFYRVCGLYAKKVGEDYRPMMVVETSLGVQETIEISAVDLAIFVAHAHSYRKLKQLGVDGAGDFSSPVRIDVADDSEVNVTDANKVAAVGVTVATEPTSPPV